MDINSSLETFYVKVMMSSAIFKYEEQDAFSKQLRTAFNEHEQQATLTIRKKTQDDRPPLLTIAHFSHLISHASVCQRFSVVDFSGLFIYDESPNCSILLNAIACHFVNLDTLDISNNYISEFPILPQSVSVTILKNNLIKTICIKQYLPRLQKLDLRGNSIRAINSQELHRFCPQLQQSNIILDKPLDGSDSILSCLPSSSSSSFTHQSQLIQVQPQPTQVQSQPQSLPPIQPSLNNSHPETADNQQIVDTRSSIPFQQVEIQQDQSQSIGKQGNRFFQSLQHQSHDDNSSGDDFESYSDSSTFVSGEDDSSNSQSSYKRKGSDSPTFPSSRKKVKSTKEQKEHNAQMSQTGTTRRKKSSHLSSSRTIRNNKKHQQMKKALINQLNPSNHLITPEALHDSTTAEAPENPTTTEVPDHPSTVSNVVSGSEEYNLDFLNDPSFFDNTAILSTLENSDLLQNAISSDHAPITDFSHLSFDQLVNTSISQLANQLPEN